MTRRYFPIGTEASSGLTIWIGWDDDPNAPHCGWNCECCEYDDGSAPIDHARSCDLVTLRAGDWSDCTCEGAEERAKDRKRVRLRTDVLGSCPAMERLRWEVPT